MTPFSNSLLSFKNSDKSKMSVITYRFSKENGFVPETETTYRKGKLNPLRINYSISYTEHYILEDRKRSVGNYVFDTLDHIARYERSDYNNRNVRMVTYYNFYSYHHNIQQREFMRIREYIGEGVEQDSVVYLDSVIYKVTRQHDNYRQDNLSFTGAYSVYNISDGRLDTLTNYMDGFHEIHSYSYDSKGRMVRIDHKLVGEDNQQISTYTILHYSAEGLLTESIFYDEKDVALEKKQFTYK